MSAKIRVGLVGLAGSGKSTLAQHWVRTKKFTKLSFAEAVKVVAEELHLEPTRSNWQTVGDGLRQLIGADVWINIMESKIRQWKANRLVVDDVRYPNEVTFLRSQGFSILGLVRPEEDRIKDRPELREAKVREHPSEKLMGQMALKDFDKLIYARELKHLLESADDWLEAKLKADLRLQTEKKTSKEDAMNYLLIIIQQQMAVINRPPPGPETTQFERDNDDRARQKASRIIIQCVKTMHMVGLDQAKTKDILDVLTEALKRTEEEKK